MNLKLNKKYPMINHRNNDSSIWIQRTASFWRFSLPGKILTICVCILPFLTRSISVNITQAVQDAYFLRDQEKIDFEQLCRVFFLVGVAVIALFYFIVERVWMRFKRKYSHDHSMLAVFLFLGIYLLIGFFSIVTSDYKREAMWGVYMNYEGWIALLGYGILFAAAWYWVDRGQVVEFLKNCICILSWILGILAILEHFGVCYYNNPIVQKLGALVGYASSGKNGVVITFGNADYLGMYCAMLLPLVVSMLFRSKRKLQILFQGLTVFLLALTLILSKVMNAMLIGFGLSVIFLLIWAFHTQWSHIQKGVFCCGTILVVLSSSFGFLWMQDGDTFAEKCRYTGIGVPQKETFQLLSVDLDENTISLKNANTTMRVTAKGTTLSPQTLMFTCNGIKVTPKVNANNLCSFSQPELKHYQVTIRKDRLDFQLGYTTTLKAIRKPDGWTVIGIGGKELSEVPKVSESEWLQRCYPYLNGRIFVWANTLSVLGDCWILGHGPSTSIFYLEQNDLPALLNIFGKYVLYNKPHCWYLQIAQDTGILSLMMILGILSIFLVRGFRNCFGKKWDSFHAGLLFAILAYILMACFNDSLIYQAPMFWFLLGVGFRQIN